MTEKQRLNALLRARRHLHNTNVGYVQYRRRGGSEWKLAEAALDLLEKDLRAKPKPAWANIGPALKGGPSVLDMSLTHKTSGISLYPAVDFAWAAGLSIIAWEPLTVEKWDTSANPGEALYLVGRSGLHYWLGHIDRDYKIGTKFAKGAFIAKVLDQKGTDHGHLAVNAEKYLGKGHDLKYGRTGEGPDYTLGAPTIRNQLLAAAA